MEPDAFLDEAGLSALRNEVEREGVLVDSLLTQTPDSAVYGVNLACAYPFPNELRAAYEALAARLSALGPSVYVYPFWETHVTIITLLNFQLHRDPTASERVRLEELTGQAADALAPLFSANLPERVRPFDLKLQRPVLSRKAALFPISNPTGEIARIRQQAAARLQADGPLYERLRQAGLNIPPIIHSTILRFVAVPADRRGFLAAFDAIAARTTLGQVRVSELLLTAETKPYMRGGEVRLRFPLSI